MGHKNKSELNVLIFFPCALWELPGPTVEFVNEERWGAHPHGITQVAVSEDSNSDCAFKSWHLRAMCCNIKPCKKREMKSAQFFQNCSYVSLQKNFLS